MKTNDRKKEIKRKESSDHDLVPTRRQTSLLRGRQLWNTVQTQGRGNTLPFSYLVTTLLKQNLSPVNSPGAMH